MSGPAYGSQNPAVRKELQTVLQLCRKWLRDEPLLTPPPPLPEYLPAYQAPQPTDPASQLDRLAVEINSCCGCKLAPLRTNTVPGEGAPQARLMVIGEAPGLEEDRQGRPFTGNAGELLDKMFAAIGFSRESLFITNVIKCRPPENRDPEPDETAACRRFIDRQIDLVNPAVICTLGKVALRVLTGETTGITRVHGNWYSYRGKPLLPIYHPAFLLRQQSRKREAWLDLQKLQQFLNEQGPN